MTKQQLLNRLTRRDEFNEAVQHEGICAVCVGFCSAGCDKCYDNEHFRLDVKYEIVDFAELLKVLEGD